MPTTSVVKDVVSDVSNYASSISDKFLGSITDFAKNFKDNLPSGKDAKDYLKYIQTYVPSGPLWFNILKASFGIILSLLFYVFYTTTQMTSLLVTNGVTITAFNGVESAVSMYSTISIGLAGIYLLLFLYVLRDNTKTDVVIYFQNLALIGIIVFSTFSGKIDTALANVNFNSLLNPTLLPQLLSIRSTQRTISNLIINLSVVIWLIGAATFVFTELALRYV